MSFANKLMNDWNQDELIAWIQSLSTDDSFTSTVKEQIVDGIKKYAQMESSAVNGEDFYDADDADDLKAMTKVDKKKAKLLWKRVVGQKQKEYDRKEKEKGATSNNQKQDTSNQPFTINIVGQQGKPVPLHGVYKTDKVKDIKAKYLAEQGNLAAADNYRNGKWGNNEKGKISMKKGGKNMDDERTLESYGIVNSFALPLVVGFKVIGGSNDDEKGQEAELKYDSDDDDKYRKRKLRRKKYRGLIKFSKQPDCIMGYNDSDGIQRAEMPCGCAICSDTMYRYMKSLFEKNYKMTKLFCPILQNQCKGNQKQREWPWPLVFAIADLSDKEKGKFSKIINNRISGSKSCPHCGASTEKPDNVKIWRVRCKACNNSDWCWQCLGTWKAGGLGPICGNSNCIGSQLNIILKDCPSVKPAWCDVADKNKEVPEARACPQCCTITEYTDACKHMHCLCCPHEFCFNCLKKWGGDNGCNHSTKCVLESRQTFK